MKYKVLVKTGSQRFAGTDSNVRLSIIGKDDQTRLHTLNTWRDDFEKGKFKKTYLNKTTYFSTYMIIKLS